MGKRRPLQRKGDVLTTTNAQLRGVKGWLLFLCLNLTILDPSAVLANLFAVTEAAKPSFDQHPEVLRFVLVNGVLRLALVVASLYVGISLWRGLAGAPAIAGKYLLAVFAYSAVAPFLPVIAGAREYASDNIMLFNCLNSLVTMAYVLAWYVYLKRSKRVKATYSAGPPGHG